MSKIKRVSFSELAPYFINENGIKRIARAKHIDTEGLVRNSQKEAHSVQKTKRTLKQIDDYVVCVLLAKNGELNHHDQELAYVAHALSAKWQNCAVLALVFGEHQQDLGQWGVDCVVHYDYDLLAHYQIDAMVGALKAVHQHYQPKHILFADDDWGGGDLLRRFAVAINALRDVASDVIEIDVNEAVRLVNSEQQEAFTTLPLLLGLRAEVSETELNLVCELVDLKRNQWLGDKTEQNADVYKMSASDVPLEQASFMMSLGNGVADVSLFLDCAEALGATVGGSRVVVDDGKLPREKQVGATGKTTQASVYLAFGISGAIQHLEGIKNCQSVVAINTDESCPMASRADVSYINDAVEVLAALKEIAEMAEMTERTDNDAQQEQGKAQGKAS